jgi:hypothetical protein
MKKKSIISLLICCMTLGMVNTSCKDMLTPDSDRHAYTVAQDTLYSYWGVLKSLQNIAERYVILNECRGDLVDGTSYVSDTIAAIINFGQDGYKDKYQDGACAYLKVSDYYHVINSCNAYIAKCDTARKVSTGQRTSYMLREYAQVMAIRAWVYMQLIYAYGTVPFYTEPMLTTDDINNFISDPTHATANAQTLANYLGPQLDSVNVMLNAQFGEEKYPQYNYYGGNSLVCHSMRTMFPIEVVLGDLYLLQGDPQACAKAAEYYYDFLNSKYCGPLECYDYFSAGDVRANIDEAQYSYFGSPYTEKTNLYSGGRYRGEAITCIPSNTGRLDGKVFTDIGRLFGFEATLSSTGSGDEADSYVGLNFYNNGYRRELIPSKGYEALCDSQNYECYIGQSASDATMELVTLPGVGDARRSWIYNCVTLVSTTSLYPFSEQFSLAVGDNTQYGKMVTKQNPQGIFSNTYPLIYRKSTIWLRYAEAINRAGFPSYAFAILKTGLTSYNDSWFPNRIKDEVYNERFSYLSGVKDVDFAAKDTLYCYVEETTDTTYKWGSKEEEGVEITTKEELEEYVNSKWQALADEANANLEEGETPVEARTFDPETDNKYVYFYVKTFTNSPADYLQKACWYLDRRDLENAASKRWLTFNTQIYLRGYNLLAPPFFKREIYGSSGYGLRDEAFGYIPGSSKTSDYLTIGVHQRGCGILYPGDTEQLSSYKYVDLVAKKIKENHGVTVTKDQIYGQDKDNPIDREWVIEAVEDLIIDEDALELAFEGCRFSDLARVAIRRGDNSFLAKRVAKRSGTMDMKLYNVLLNQNNWYLPFPTE